MKRLPTGRQNFKAIIEEDLVYVDKTLQIYQLILEGNLYFLSRPRRFGKSLLISTLEHIFSGQKELFQNLAIGQKTEYSWEAYPILQFNFASYGHRVENLEEHLRYELEEYAKKYNLQISNISLSLQFQSLVEQIAQKGKPVVILIDEYDKPLVDFLTERRKAKANQEVLRDFFSPLKNLEKNGHLQFLFITGVSKFSKVSLFSDLNNLTDLSISPVAHDLLGITHEELLHYFDFHIQRSAQQLQMSKKELLKGIQLWYNGYSFEGNTRLYNPYSLLNFFEQSRFRNFWFATGTPTFLVKELQRQKTKPKEMEGITVSETSFDKFDLDHLDMYMLLFQTGYLTIRKAERKRYRMRYTLGYPNQEVREAFIHNLLEVYTHQSPTIVSQAMILIEDALQENDLKEFIAQLKVLFSDISYHLLPKLKQKGSTKADEAKAFQAWEGYFQTVIYLVTSFLGLAVQSEITHHKGRLDLLIEADDYLYIMEFKLEEDVADAIAQIKSREYLTPYYNSPKTVVLVGISFDKAERNVKEWVAEEWLRT